MEKTEKALRGIRNKVQKDLEFITGVSAGEKGAQAADTVFEDSC